MMKFRRTRRSLGQSTSARTHTVPSTGSGATFRMPIAAFPMNGLGPLPALLALLPPRPMSLDVGAGSTLTFLTSQITQHAVEPGGLASCPTRETVQQRVTLGALFG